MDFREKIDKILSIKEIRPYKLAEISKMGNTLEKAYQENREMTQTSTDKFLRNMGISSEWWEHQKGPVFLIQKEENITPVENEPAIPQKTPLKETFYRELIEDNENYSLIPKAILSDYKIVPEKLLDMITQSKDELNGELKEKHKLIIQGYENRINRLEEDKAALVAENERLQRQIPAKNE